MRFWANLVGYQIVWFAVVISAAREQPWWGMLVALVFVVAQWLASRQRTSDTRLLACAVGLGIVLDGTLASSGLLHYAASQPAVLAPVWILALWAAFAMTMNHSLAFLQKHIVWAAGLGAVGAPLAYLGAARGFGAVEFAAPAWHALVALAIGWTIALSLLAWLARIWHQTSPFISVEVIPR